MKTNYIDKEICLRPITMDDIETLWEIAHGNLEAEWTRWNGPYFNSPGYTYEKFVEEVAPQWIEKDDIWLIQINEEIIGTISWYWEDAPLNKSLEFGISIYKDEVWNQSIGTRILRMWISYIFTSFENLYHIAFTTWSSNRRMITVGERLGMQEEARIRNVRHHNRCHYDSIKYGLLRSEWEENPLFHRTNIY